MSEEAYAHLYGNLTSNTDIRGFRSKTYTLQQDKDSPSGNHVSRSSMFPRLLSQTVVPYPRRGYLKLGIDGISPYSF